MKRNEGGRRVTNLAGWAVAMVVKKIVKILQPISCGRMRRRQCEMVAYFVGGVVWLGRLVWLFFFCTAALLASPG